MSKIYPIILSGGSGTRLWPLSRSMYPKQFIRFFGEGTSSFLGATLKRLTGGTGFAPPILLCNNDHRFLVKDELDRAGIEAGAVYLEPVARNTAPAIAVAALAVTATDPNGVMVVMPSDHIIRDEVKFVAAVERAAPVAATGRLVLFGIKPAEAHTGYGYIRQGAALPDFPGAAFAVDASSRSPTPPPPPPMSRPAPTSGTAASSSFTPAPSSRNWPASPPAFSRRRAARWPAPSPISAACVSTAPPSRRHPRSRSTTP